jgi:hypothetical protein
MYIYTVHKICDGKLEAVLAEMAVLGSPKIRVVDCGDYYQSLEGSHRIAAAHKLGIDLDLVVLNQEDLVLSDSLDWQDLTLGEHYTAGELAGDIWLQNTNCFKVLKNGAWE